MIDPKYSKFIDVFLDINQLVNLSAARDPDTLWKRHIADSLSLLELPELVEGARVLDLGTGGGLPGLPLAIARPDLSITMLDATAKKLRAIDTMISQLGLDNAHTLHGRAEELGRHRDFRQSFDVVIARAVARLPMLLEYAGPLCKRGGHVIAMKGSDFEVEMEEAESAQFKLRLDPARVHEYRLGAQPFYLLIYPLRQFVPKSYPRKNNLIRSNPL